MSGTMSTSTRATLILLFCLAMPIAALAQAIPLNAPLFDALDRYHRAGVNSSAALDHLRTVAAERQRRLQNLLGSDPGAVLSSALPDDVRGRMPRSVQALVGQHVQLQGRVEVAVEDGPDYSRLHYGLEVAGQQLQLHFAGDLPDGWLTGMKVQVSGVRVGDAVALVASKASVLQ